MNETKRVRVLLNQLKGIANAREKDYLPDGTVEKIIVDDYNNIIKHIASISEENLQNLVIPDTEINMYQIGGLKCRGTVFNSKLSQAISYIETRFDLSEELVDIGSTIKAISDSQLRDRCIDLLSADANFDRVFREATTILEDRIRSAAGLDDKHFGTKLVDAALNLTNGVLELAGGQKEKEGFFLIFKGVMLAFRDETHHKIIDNLTRTDAIRLVSLIDILLQVLASARKRT